MATLNFREMSPDEARRLQSGIWERRLSYEDGCEEWVCDMIKLEDKIRELVCDRRYSQAFANDPIACLDMMFGEGTGRAYFTKRRDLRDPYLHMRTYDTIHGCRFKGTQALEQQPEKKETEYQWRSQRTKVKDFPFSTTSWIDNQCSLIAQLQSAFNAWAGKECSDVQQWLSTPLTPRDIVLRPGTGFTIT